MALSFGRELLAIPGPTTVPDRVLRAMARPVANIYEGEVVDTANALLRDLPAIARGSGEAFIYIANGHGGWEAANANIFSRGDRALVLESGRFAVGWGEMAREQGVSVDVLDATPGRAIDPAAVEEKLRADDAAAPYKAVLMVQIDTSTGLWNDVAAVRAAMDAAGHDALLCVDVIASLGCVPFEMDAWGVDVVVGGSQKGLMCPPGLAFNWVSDKAMAAHARADLVTQYWSWSLRREEPPFRKFCGTAPVNHLFALREALDMIAAEGLETIWSRHRTLAEATRAAVTAWGEAGALAFHAREAAERSDSVTAIRTNGFDVEALRAFCHRELGVVMGIGLPPLDEGRGFRIGHMGWVNAQMLMGALGATQIGLDALGAPHGGDGLAAAARVIAQAARR